MIDAAEMAKHFDKRPAEFLQLPSTIEFMEELIAMGKSHRSEIVLAENGIGTWMHEDGLPTDSVLFLTNVLNDCTNSDVCNKRCCMICTVQAAQ